MFVTARTPDETTALAEVVEGLVELGIQAQADGEVLVADGQRVVPGLVERAHPTPADLRDLVAAAPSLLPSMVVADRISEAGRAVLRDAGWGWFDRRGHLRLWAPGLRIETALPDPRRDRPSSGNPWTPVGLEVALAALCFPDEPVSARHLAGRIGRSPGAIHELIGRFVDQGLVGARTHLPLLPDLFWETAARWPDDGWMPLAVGLEEVAERVGADELVRVDERAATLGGARIAAAADLPARAYVRTPGALRRLRGLAERGRPTRSWVRSSPVRWLPELADWPPDDTHPWRVAHPLVCALRLATDPARGREIVESWGIVPGAPTEAA